MAGDCGQLEHRLAYDMCRDRDPSEFTDHDQDLERTVMRSRQHFGQRIAENSHECDRPCAVKSQS